MKCPQLHESARYGNELHVPYVSRYQDEDGKHMISLRPPLGPAWDAFFQSHGKPKVIAASISEMYGADRIITFEPGGMRQLNLQYLTTCFSS